MLESGIDNLVKMFKLSNFASFIIQSIVIGIVIMQPTTQFKFHSRYGRSSMIILNQYTPYTNAHRVIYLYFHSSLKFYIAEHAMFLIGF